jgi:hypothetical protein
MTNKYKKEKNINKKLSPISSRKGKLVVLNDKNIVDDMMIETGGMNTNSNNTPPPNPTVQDSTTTSVELITSSIDRRGL